ncbi:Aste57867_16520 [Aphanomyces stellatus]|uniref:Aste57867_16520 protein n=1 Tax=Aphanomyces stellatus TaxID=120398 RepID=A0A485L7J3_9STRA|nr:hypothetical protein As57867_016463 [Aphanomyces stellatus]VFT93294.1 Aste57867_16520 [Aphanomyces stellatus]
MYPCGRDGLPRCTFVPPTPSPTVYPCGLNGMDRCTFVPTTPAPTPSPTVYPCGLNGMDRCTFVPTTHFVTTAPTTCQDQEFDVDYPGNDIAETLRESADLCCDDCSNTPGCTLYVFTDYNGGTCWLKSGKGDDNAVAYPGAIAAEL